MLSKLQLNEQQVQNHEESFSLMFCFPGGTSGKEPACQCRRQEMRVRSLAQEDPLEEGMAIHSRESHGCRDLVGYNP